MSITRILREPEVEKRTGLSRTQRYRLQKAGQFPAPIKLGVRASGWVESEIEDWVQSRVAAREQGGDA